ncbi:secondary thiamine-phosphate synthase enzyme YjbQ [Kordiimonas marina]|uniref:secondary thiamine-phosphate synthase enzyme YjbQ n=1 Tax=Kordiimonas marina TaxID=2872312 RepID=UPI001FF615EC|nr:secondary thiamine-phosphate synthase enzyme YjbQ [Kordiimonas marina]MCJ9429778.1 secondary thiamine-phosphate synthase enzyme YjbQ [Kordiimonas marina]
MRQAQQDIHAETHGPGLYDITRSVASWVRGTGIDTGLLTLFIRHTSASLTIQENADPDVLLDLQDAMDRLAPSGRDLYRHSAEGPDDMPAHIKSALTDTTLTIPVRGGLPALGTWQGIYVFEHRKMAHNRTVVCHLMGE